MAQDYFKINGTKIYTPDQEIEWSWEETHSTNSGRPQSGDANVNVLFTVQKFTYKATDVPMSEVSKILKLIVGKNSYTAHVFSPYENAWVDVVCYTGAGDVSIKSLKDNYEKVESLSFNMVGKNKM